MEGVVLIVQIVLFLVLWAAIGALTNSLALGWIFAFILTMLVGGIIYDDDEDPEE